MYQDYLEIVKALEDRSFDVEKTYRDIANFEVVNEISQNPEKTSYEFIIACYFVFKLSIDFIKTSGYIQTNDYELEFSEEQKWKIQSHSLDIMIESYVKCMIHNISELTFDTRFHRRCVKGYILRILETYNIQE